MLTEAAKGKRESPKNRIFAVLMKDVIRAILA